MPRIIRLAPNSLDWLKWREGGIGASDAPIILGESKFKDPYKLWLEKTHQVEPGKTTFVQQKGKDLEHEAREAYCLEVGEIMPPANLVADPPHEWLRCSLDCRRPDGKLIAEIKCPDDAGDHITAREGQIPAQYYAQVQQALFVSGAERCDYWSYFEGEGVRIAVKPDMEWFKVMALPVLEEFWRRVKERTWPMPAGELDEKSTTPHAWALIEAACEDLFQVRMMKTAIEARERTAENEVKRLLGNHKKVRAAGIEASWVFVKGGAQVSYTTSPNLYLKARRVVEKKK